MDLDVWQLKGLEADFSDVWQRKRLEEKRGKAPQRDPCASEEKRIGKGESTWRQTRERIAEKYTAC